LASCLAALCTLAILIGSPASAHFDSSGKYTHANNQCNEGSRVDPVNVVFYTWGTFGRAENQIQAHAGWFNAQGSDQYFADHGSCNLFHTQRASGDSDDTRFHVRVRGQHSDPNPSLNWTAMGDAHHEDWVPSCDFFTGGHAVDSNSEDPSGSGFDQGRTELAYLMGFYGHTYYYTWWGNTQNFLQCDGDLAGSDGNTAFIQLHQVNH
jgi:hypothetical protein